MVLREGGGGEDRQTDICGQKGIGIPERQRQAERKG